MMNILSGVSGVSAVSEPIFSLEIFYEIHKQRVNPL